MIPTHSLNYQFDKVVILKLFFVLCKVFHNNGKTHLGIELKGSAVWYTETYKVIDFVF